MSGFLRRSLWQVVAAVVLFAGAGASDLFAATTHTTTAATAGGQPATVKGTLWKWVTVNGMSQWVRIELLPPDGFNPFAMPLVNTTPTGQQGYNYYTYSRGLTGLTPGVIYAVVHQTETGTAPNYTYTKISEDQWTQP